MLAAQRRAKILEEVTALGAMKLADLSGLLGVSEATVRRDVECLSANGSVSKVHGGVTTNTFSATREPEFANTLNKETASKLSIARAALRLVSPGSAVALMGGSTVYGLAKQLLDVPTLTIVTNSIPVFTLFSADSVRNDWTVVLAGGERTPTDSLVGAVTEQAFRLFNFDVAFLGTYGMDPQGGFSSPNMLEAEVNRLVISNSQRVAVLADHTKWAVRGFSSFGPISCADTVIVDEGLPEEGRNHLREHAGEFITVSPALA